MLCLVCGKELEEGIQSCPHCGAYVAQGTSSPDTSLQTKLLTKNPTELLREQTLLLNQISANLVGLQRLQQQTSQQLSKLRKTQEDNFDGQIEVAVTHFYMSFLELVGFLLKFYFASLLAGLILLPLLLGILFIISMVTGGIISSIVAQMF